MTEPLVAPKVHRFRYLRDPLFLAAVALYLLNRFAIKPYTGNSSDFFHRWANDLLCVPFWLPPILVTLRRFRLRDHDAPPTWPEIILLVVSWSFVFEMLVPSSPSLHQVFPHAFSDLLDVLFYVVGGIAAGLIWRSGETPPLPDGPGHRDRWQHFRWALGIAITTIIGTLAFLAPHQWRTQNRVHAMRGHLEQLAHRIEAMQEAQGRWPTTLGEVSERDAEKIDYVTEGASFALIDLGDDRARGGTGDAADVWWPASRQPDDPWYAIAFTADTEHALAAGSSVGLFFAVVWLLWRGTRTPSFPHLTSEHRARLFGVFAVLLLFTLGVLWLQNGFLESASQSSH